jgi:hypothetical protein
VIVLMTMKKYFKTSRHRLHEANNENISSSL